MSKCSFIHFEKFKKYLGPIQVIRYDNRLEIIKPESEERLGEPGSETRNPFIAAVFHETNN